MSYTVTKYPQGTFCWADAYSSDVEKTRQFMSKLMGWTSEDMPTGEGSPNYTMFSLDGKYTAGASQTNGQDNHSIWCNYISVDNLDEIVQKATELGATIVAPAMDVLDSGRVAAIVDPTGAVVNFWQPKKHIGAQVVNTVGAMCWNELNTKDIERAKDFYAKLLGWTFETDQAGYVNIFNNGRRNGGMFPLPPEMQSMPANWMAYFTVKNIEETIAKTKEMGGQVYMGPKDISVGKIAVIADPAGASFMAIELSVEPDPWQD